MSNVERIVVVLAVAVLVTGCRSESTGSTPVSPSAGAGAGEASGGPAPLPESNPPTTPALVPITPADGRSERVAQWRAAGQADGGRRLLLDVQVGGPPCDTVTGVDVVESATAVTVTVHAGRLATADCPDGFTGALATFRVEARLQQPLADRTLLASQQTP